MSFYPWDPEWIRRESERVAESRRRDPVGWALRDLRLAVGLLASTIVALVVTVLVHVWA